MEQKVCFEDTAGLLLDELHTALYSIDPQQVELLMEAIIKADRVYFVGVGRVLLSLEAIAKRWAHLGIKTHIVGEISEPAITPNDILIVGSSSGSTIIPLNIAKKAYSLGAKVVHIGSNPSSELKDIASFMVRIPVRTKHYLEDEIDSLQPMTSLFEQTLLLLGDIVAKMLIDRSGLDLKDLWRYHANLE